MPKLFEEAVLGAYSLITDPGRIEERSSIEVSKESGSVEGRLVGILNEVIYRFDTDGFVGRRADVRLEGNTAHATVFGEEFDPERHTSGLLLKAATYHGLKVEQRENRWEAEIIFDI